MEIVTHGGGVILFYIFNAIASITSGNDFVDLVVISASFAMIWLGLKAGFGLSSKKEMFIWFFGYMILYQAMIVPKSTVVITDKFDPTYTATVDNVPYGLTVIGSYTSIIGNGIAELFDQSFALPNDQSYSENGFLFGNKVIQEASKLTISDDEFASNMSEYIQQCVYYDIKTAKKYTFNDLKNADDIWSFVTVDNAPSKVMMFEYETNGNRQIVTCHEGALRLFNKWNEEISSSMTYLYERTYGKAESEAIARTFITSQIENSNQFLMGMSQNASTILRQNLMINAMNRASYEYGTDNLAQYADLIAKEETRTAYARTAVSAQLWVPLLRNVFEAILYGIFPFVFLVFILPNGAKTFMSYIQAFVWIQAWPPLYAILHLMLSITTQQKLAFANGYDLNNFSLINQITQDVSLSAGYMMMSIPLLAFFILRGISSMAYSASTLLGAAQASVQGAAAEMTRGNYSIGNSSLDNHSYDNISANKIDNSVLSSTFGGVIENQDGSNTKLLYQGRTVTDMSGAIDKLPVDLRSNLNMSNALETRSSELQSLGESANKSAMSSLTSTVDYATRMSEEYRNAKENGESWVNSLDSSTQKSFDNIESYTSQMNTTASLSTGDSLAGGLAKSLIGASIGGSVSFTKDDQDVFKNSLDQINKASKSGSFSTSSSEMSALSKDFSSNYSEYQQQSQTAEVYLNQSQNLANEASKHESSGVSSNRDESRAFMKYLSDDIGYNESEVRNLMIDPDRRQTLDSHISNYMNDRVDEQYLSSYNSKLINDLDISEKAFDSKDLEFDNLVNRSSEVEGKFNDLMSDKDVSVSRKDIRAEVENAFDTNQEQLGRKSSESQISSRIASKLENIKDKFDSDDK